MIEALVESVCTMFLFQQDLVTAPPCHLFRGFIALSAAKTLIQPGCQKCQKICVSELVRTLPVPAQKVHANL